MSTTRHLKPWLQREEDFIAAKLEIGCGYREISLELGRTYDATRARGRKLGLATRVIPDEFLAAVEEPHRARDIRSRFGVCQTTVHKWKKRLQALGCVVWWRTHKLRKIP
jgi:hypothetical protein